MSSDWFSARKYSACQAIRSTSLNVSCLDAVLCEIQCYFSTFFEFPLIPTIKSRFHPTISLIVKIVGIPTIKEAWGSLYITSTSNEWMCARYYSIVSRNAVKNLTHKHLVIPWNFVCIVLFVWCGVTMQMVASLTADLKVSVSNR